MKSKIFMYLFFFAALFIVFQYMNEKSIYGNQEKTINALSSKTKAQTDSIKKLEEQISDSSYFTLQGNDNAMSYFENQDMNVAELENRIREAIIEKNLESGGNPLVPLEGMFGEMRVNNMRFLNHRWIQAEFSDGKKWGEMIIEYFVNEDGSIDMTAVSSCLYPN